MKRHKLLPLLLVGMLALTPLLGLGETAMYPISADGSVELTYWLPIHNNAIKYISSYAENEAYQEIQRRTGVTVDFIHPVAGQEQQQFNLLMASGELPDMVQRCDLYSGGELKGVEDGAFIDLAPYLEEFAPDYWALITANDEIKREVFSEDGKVAAFYRINENPIPVADRAIVRQDWLDEFGMDVPQTLDQFEQYFQNVLASKPGVVPFMLPRQNYKGPSFRHAEVFMGAYNVIPDWFVQEGKVQFGLAHPNFKQYLAKMADWYAKGYISRDFPAVEDKQKWAEFDSGTLAMTVDSVDVARTRAEPLGMSIASCPLPRVTEDQKLHTLIEGWPKQGDATAISTSCKNIEAAVKFLNYGYTQEGSRLYHYGVEGQTYNLVDGKIVYTDYILNNPKFDAESANYILRVHFAPKYQTETPLEFNPAIVKNAAAVAFRLKWTDDPNVDNSYRFPPVSLNAEENTRRAEIMTNVVTYADEMVLKFIVGTEPIENFDAYVAQLNQFGLEEALQITQNAYDRYMSK